MAGHSAFFFFLPISFPEPTVVILPAPLNKGNASSKEKRSLLVLTAGVHMKLNEVLRGLKEG